MDDIIAEHTDDGMVFTPTDDDNPRVNFQFENLGQQQLTLWQEDHGVVMFTEFLFIE